MLLSRLGLCKNESMKKRPTDPFQLAKLIGDIATGKVKDAEQTPSDKKKQNIKDTTNHKK